MKNKLLKKLSRPNIDRRFKWFWLNHIKKSCSITYQYFMRMLDGSTTMRDDVKASIQKYLGKNQS